MGSNKPPKPSAAQNNASQAQADLLTQQRSIMQAQYDQQQLLAPLLYKQNNVEPTYGADGKITGFRDLGPTPEQTAYQHSLAAQEKNLAYSQALQPLQFQQQGYNVQKDENGMPTGFTLIPGGAADLQAQYATQQLATGKQQQEVNQLLLDRSKQALAGNLPVDPSLQRQFDTSEQVLRSSLAKNLGPGYETSTPGIQALAQARQRRDETIYGAQHGEIGYADQLAMAGQSGGIQPQGVNPWASIGNSGTTAQYLSPFASQGSSNARSAQLLGTVGAPFSNSSGFGTLAQMYGQDAGQLQQSQMAGYVGGPSQATKAIGGALSGAATGATIGSGAGPYGTAIGAVGGALVGAGAGYFS